jgi:hypothetical protein
MDEPRQTVEPVTRLSSRGSPPHRQSTDRSADPVPAIQNTNASG